MSSIHSQPSDDSLSLHAQLENTQKTVSNQSKDPMLSNMTTPKKLCDAPPTIKEENEEDEPEYGENRDNLIQPHRQQFRTNTMLKKRSSLSLNNKRRINGNDVEKARTSENSPISVASYKAGSSLNRSSSSITFEKQKIIPRSRTHSEHSMLSSLSLKSLVHQNSLSAAKNNNNTPVLTSRSMVNINQQIQSPAMTSYWKNTINVNKETNDTSSVATSVINQGSIYSDSTDTREKMEQKQETPSLKRNESNGIRRSESTILPNTKLNVTDDDSRNTSNNNDTDEAIAQKNLTTQALRKLSFLKTSNLSDTNDKTSETSSNNIRESFVSMTKSNSTVAAKTDSGNVTSEDSRMRHGGKSQLSVSSSSSSSSETPLTFSRDISQNNKNNGNSNNKNIDKLKGIQNNVEIERQNKNENIYQNTALVENRGQSSSNNSATSLKKSPSRLKNVSSNEFLARGNSSSSTNSISHVPTPSQQSRIPNGLYTNQRQLNNRSSQPNIRMGIENNRTTDQAVKMATQQQRRLSSTLNSMKQKRYVKQINNPKKPLYIPAVLRNVSETNITNEDIQVVMRNINESHGSIPHQGVLSNAMDNLLLSSQSSVRSTTSSLVESYKSKIVSLFSHSNDSSKTEPTHEHWVPDSERTSCRKCQKQFTFIERKHHCRHCGEIYCALHLRHWLYLDKDANFIINKNVMTDPMEDDGILCKVCDFCLEKYETLSNPNGGSKSNADTEARMETAKTTERSSTPIPQKKGGEGDNSENGDTENGKKRLRGSSIVGSVPADWNWSSF
ncbi:hypothetical protein NCAS_0A01730 [Naumovozyma castellii]|uniref:FYVE-type domain-containing protein n=1 Tax=Naumovozyma castellii TaxID=27288 RepID=G0V5J5_NAUCA|nr:hypothetical protein NCAS_0A01730 [Naumovozyma castellii CBS 4309]CCC66731.1 hypothetical protein NCAS_0A01730 [Naumovozyma castellii CBS 4309]